MAKRVTKEMNIGGEDYDSSIISTPQKFRGFRKAQIKNARNLMYALYERGEIDPAEYWAWKKKAGKIE